VIFGHTFNTCFHAYLLAFSNPFLSLDYLHGYQVTKNLKQSYSRLLFQEKFVLEKTHFTKSLINIFGFKTINPCKYQDLECTIEKNNKKSLTPLASVYKMFILRNHTLSTQWATTLMAVYNYITLQAIVLKSCSSP